MFYKSYRLVKKHTTPGGFENGALFLRLGLPSTNPELFENALENGALRFIVDAKHFENEAFRKR